MEIKIHKRTMGIPAAKATIVGSQADAENTAKVVLAIHAIDAFSMKEVVATLRLRPDEAVDMSHSLRTAAAEARTREDTAGQGQRIHNAKIVRLRTLTAALSDVERVCDAESSLGALGEEALLATREAIRCLRKAIEEGQ